MDQWGVGRAGVNDGLVVLFDLDTTLKHGQVQLYAGGGFADRYLTTDELQAIFDEDMAPLLQGGDLDSALLVGLAKVVSGVFDATRSPGSEPAVVAPAPGPPFPPPETDRAVYDYAGILSAGGDRQGRGDDRCDRGPDGAEVVVYTQDSGDLRRRRRRPKPRRAP